MNHIPQYRTVKYALIFILTAALLIIGSGPGISHAELLSGANGSTLQREPQQTPDGLGASGLNGLQFADAAAQIDLVQPPTANNQGDAQIAHALSVPAGRAGLQPELALTYSSGGGNGWTGVGWDLSVGEVTIDTRWGAPRYDAANESETYLLDGEVLAPTAVRATLEAREAERIFHRRVEGEFERVIRHGSAPGSYWWEVADKSGTNRYYGGTPEDGRDASAILADDSGNGFSWALKQVRDISSNTMTFHYETATGTGVGANNASIGRELYLSFIAYTGTVAGGLPDDPAYEVRFLRDSQLNESQRPDVSVDGIGGFLRVTSDLLRHVDVYYRGTMVRRFVLNYSTGPFSKSLLANVVQAGSDGVEYARHTFEYYDDIRSGSTYNGFTAVPAWQTYEDNIKYAVPLIGGVDNASALSGTESQGGDGRAYIGFNPFSPTKEGSFGGAFSLGGADGSSRLEFFDINGDNLPDKIFEENGQVKFRLNQSGPNGLTTFSSAKPAVSGINNLSRENSFSFGIGPEAYFGISLMYNHAWTWTWGKEYFIDVNADGLPDFVDNGTVYFNHLDVAGVPHFSTNSGDTVVPIEAGSVDPNILAGFDDIEAQQRAQSPLQDTIRQWEAPWNGTVTIQGTVALLPPALGGVTGDGVRVAIQRENVELWSAIIPITDYNVPINPTGVSNIAVQKGDNIYFRVGSRDDGASDAVAWDPLITYSGLSPRPDANGLDVYRYQASEDFTLGGRSEISAKTPLDGTVRVTGDFEKLRKTTDDIAVQIIKNGAAVGSAVFIGRDSTGVTPVSLDFAVAQDDDIQLRLKIDSPVDLSAFSWLPRLYYLDATDAGGNPVEVTDALGNPTLDLQAPVDIQMYPRNNLSAPLNTWTAPANGSVEVATNPTFCFLCFESGTVNVTIKKKITPALPGDPPAEWVARQTITVVNGAVTAKNPATLNFTYVEDTEYWFEVTVPDPLLGMSLNQANLKLDYPDPTSDVVPPFAQRVAYIPEDVFPMAYRGWGVAGYNGDGDLAGQVIIQENLDFNEDDYPDAEPPLLPGTDPDYPTSDDVDPSYQDPTQGKSFIYAPFVEVDGSGNVIALKWIGTKDNLFGSATGMGSSRVGLDSIGLPGADQILGASAVTRFSLTEADAIAGGVGGLIGGSFAWGTSEGKIDFIDMNGDLFPDILGNGGVQYTTVRGGMESSLITQGALDDNVREDSTTTKTLDGGGTAAEIKADSKGDGNNSQKVATTSGQKKRSGKGKGDNGSGGSGEDAQSGPSLGLSGGLGWSSTNTSEDSPFGDLLENELADINGDGLPDRIKTYKNGDMTVNFNLGYAFDPTPVYWAGGTFESGSSDSFSIGPTLGFSTPTMSFGGGVAVSSADEQSETSWVDLNGDGLLDQLRLGNSSVIVRFGTGAGLTADVDFGAFRDNKISVSKSSSLGGGVDFTIGIGPLCIAACYVIINPGGHYEGGMTRQELELQDINGDGYPDHLASTDDYEIEVSENNTGRTNLLKEVSNPLGGSFEVDYTRMGNTVVQPYSQWVLSEVAVDDGRAGDGPDVQLSTYEYSGNAYNSLERAFLGYSQVTERQHDTSDAALPVLRYFEREYLNGTIFEDGLLIRETMGGPGGYVSETINEYQFVEVELVGNVVQTGALFVPNPDPAAGVDQLAISAFPQLIRSEDRWYDGVAVAKRSWDTFTYDALGNITQIHDVGEPDLPGDDLFAELTYTDCTGSTWVGLADSIIIKGSSVDTLRSRRAELLCANGAVTKLWEDSGSGEALTELEFNAYGSYNRIIYPPNADGERYEVLYQYDADRFTDIARVDDSYGLVGLATYHDPTGQIAAQTDANGQVTTYTYDAVGRLASIKGPYEQGTGNTSVSFEYFPTAPAYAYGIAHHFDLFNPSDTIDTVSFLDGIGRETQTKQDAALFRGAGSTAGDVMVVAGAVEYDALGREVKEWYPIEEPLGTPGVYNTGVDSVNPTLTSWSLTDKPTQVVAPNGNITTTSYDYDDGTLFGTVMFLTTLTDPLGNARLSYSDMRDNILANELDHDDGSTVQTLRTSYEYDPMGSLLKVIDPAGNETTHEYDLLGRRTTTTTPDGGRIELAYDLASHVTSKVTPNLRATGDAINYSYDFDRLEAITYTDGTTPNVTYEYGGPGAPDNGAGRIVRLEDGARRQTRKFGRLGEVVEETTTMLVHNLNDNTEARLTWVTAAAFDTWGRRVEMTYPDDEVVSYGYDSGGLINFMAGLKDGTNYSYLNRQEYDKFLERAFVETGNGVQTETQFDPQTRRLQRQMIAAPDRAIQDLNYTYDAVGNVLALSNDAPVPLTDLMGGTSQQEFVYDDLYRLVSAEGAYDFAPRKVRRYTYALEYDILGNIRNKSQTDHIFNNPNSKKGIEQMKTTYDYNYDFGATPHQPTHIGHQTYTYDANGNFTGWTDDDSGQNRTVTWDAEDRVTSVADQGATTRYTYDDEDRLAIERGPQGETSFVNRFYTVRNGTVAWKHFWAGPERIATKRQMPDDEYDEEDFEHMLYFLHKDLLGSTNLVTDRLGKVFEYLMVFPGGETWVLEHSDIHRVPYLYTGGYYDEFRNLYNLGARWYEPREQFFYSPDPLLSSAPEAALDDPALLGAYSYAEDNPMNLVDRDGRAPEYAQRAFRAAFFRPDGSVDQTKLRILNALVQQTTEQVLGKRTSRLIAKVVANKESFKKGFKAFAEFQAKPVVQVNLTRTPDGLKLKNVKVAPFFFKQFTVKKGKGVK